MKNFVNNSPETQAIRQRMEEVRGDLDTGFQGIVNDARDIGDWTYYVKSHPWAILGVSLVAGYLFAPRLGLGTQEQTLPADGTSSSNDPNAPTSKGVASGKVLSMVGNLVMQGATAYVLQHADKLFESKAHKLFEAKTVKSSQNDRQ